MIKMLQSVVECDSAHDRFTKFYFHTTIADRFLVGTVGKHTIMAKPGFVPMGVGAVFGVVAHRFLPIEGCEQHCETDSHETDSERQVHSCAASRGDEGPESNLPLLLVRTYNVSENLTNPFTQFRHSFPSLQKYYAGKNDDRLQSKDHNFRKMTFTEQRYTTLKSNQNP